MKNLHEKNATQLLKELQLMKQLKTTVGFYSYFFELLPKYTTRIEAFNAANDKYFELYDEYRYSSYNSFAAHRWQLNAKKKKK